MTSSFGVVTKNLYGKLSITKERVKTDPGRSNFYNEAVVSDKM